MIEGNPSGRGSAPHRIFTFNMIFTDFTTNIKAKKVTRHQLLDNYDQ